MRKPDIIFTVLFIPLILGYPFLFFNMPFLKIFIKYPTLITCGILLFLFAAYRLKLIIDLEVLILFSMLIVISFSFVEILIECAGYSVLYLFGRTVFKEFRYRLLFSKLYIWLATIVSIHALVQFSLVALGAVSFKSTEFPGAVGIFSNVFGVFGTLDWMSFRVASFFTEANRLAYFLIPVLCLLLANKNAHQKSPFFKFRFLLIFTAFILTHSVFAFAALIFSFFVHGRGKLLWLAILVLVGIVIFLGSSNSDFSLFDRSTSFSHRLASLYHLSHTLLIYPFGVPVELREIIFGIAPVYTAPIFWSVVSGLPGLIFVMSFGILIFARTIKNNKISRRANFLSVGMCSYLLCQGFMGIMFESLFMLLLAWYKSEIEGSKHDS